VNARTESADRRERRTPVLRIIYTQARNHARGGAAEHAVVASMTQDRKVRDRGYALVNARNKCRLGLSRKS
jgi:hypothetical protein